MKKNNKFIEIKKPSLGPSYEFVDSNGKDIPLVMTESKKKFLIVDEFSDGASVYVAQEAINEDNLSSVDDEEIVYAEEVFEDEDDIYANELKDRLVKKEEHRKFNVIGESIDECYQKNGYHGNVGHKLISSMLFSRIINVPTHDGVEDEIECLCKTISSTTFSFDYDENSNIAYITKLYDAISYAKNNRNKPVFIQIKKARASGLLDFIRPLYAYLDNPTGDSYITAMGKSIYVPHNLYVIFSLAPNEILFDVSRRLLRYVSILKLDVKAVKSAEKETASLSLEEINASLREAGDERCLLEDSWKKIDSLAAFINKSNGYVIQNKIVRRIEDFAASLFCLDLSEDDILDQVLALNVISEAVITANPADFIIDNALNNEITNSFGADGLPLTREIVKSYLSLFDKGGKRLDE